MLHQPLIAPVPVRGILKIERVGHAGVEMEEVERQQIVERVAARVNDPRGREERLDEADVQEVVRALVGDHPSCVGLSWQTAEVKGSPTPDRLSVRASDWVRIARNATNKGRNEVEFA